MNDAPASDFAIFTAVTNLVLALAVFLAIVDFFEMRTVKSRIERFLEITWHWSANYSAADVVRVCAGWSLNILLRLFGQPLFRVRFLLRTFIIIFAVSLFANLASFVPDIFRVIQISSVDEYIEYGRSLQDNSESNTNNDAKDQEFNKWYNSTIEGLADAMEDPELRQLANEYFGHGGKVTLVLTFIFTPCSYVFHIGYLFSFSPIQTLVCNLHW